MKDDYLSNTKAPVQLLGLATLMNPNADKVSSQRGTMWSHHAPQAQVLHGCEHPRLFSGFESKIGEYEYSTTERDQGIQVLEPIPRFIVGHGVYPIKSNPYYTIVYRGDRDNKVGCFQLERHTMRSNGYGYKNKWPNYQQLNKGNYIEQDVKLCTSPAHDGNKYMMGTNLRTVYMSLPGVTEDAFIISESAAKKLSSDSIGRISFKILPNQIPKDLYGKDDEYRFMPDIGEFVRSDGVFCALCTPTQDSIISDMSKENLTKVQYLHDQIFFLPPGAEILDIDVSVNRKCKIKAPREVFSQVQKYRDPINAYHIKIWEAYQQAVKDGREITPAFNSQVTRSISSLLADNVRIPGYSKKADVTLVRKKEAIEFLHFTVTYKHVTPVNRGHKLTGRSGNKGVVSVIWKDEWMPVDDYGIRADIIVDPVSVFNRMNPSQWYEQFILRVAEMMHIRIKDMFAGKDPRKDTLPWEEAFSLLVDFLGDVNPKYAELINRTHSSLFEKQELIGETIRDGIYAQLSPCQEGIDQKKIIFLEKKYDIHRTPLSFVVPRQDGSLRHVRTKKPMLIGHEYWYTLYKIPHMHCSGLAYVNQYHCPVRANALAKLLYPLSQTPIRLGEDEIRNLTMGAGADTAARILGLYANSLPAVTLLGEHLLFDECPSKLEQIEMTTDQIIRTNSVNNVVKHIFSCFGVNITPNVQKMTRNIYADLELPTDRR